MLHHAYQGTNLFPLAVIYSLKDQERDQLMCKSFEEYGFLLEDESELNPYGLPVGMAADFPRTPDGKIESFLGIEVPVVGLNCAACHTGELKYAGKRYRIDGAPNMIDVELWTADLAKNVQALIDNKPEGLAFLVRFLSYRDTRASKSIGEQFGIKKEALDHLASATNVLEELGFMDKKPNETAIKIKTHVEGKLGELFERIFKKLEPHPLTDPEFTDDMSEEEKIVEAIEHILFELRSRIELANKTVNAINSATQKPGPGRDDAWGLVQIIVMDDKNSTLNAPIGTPHLFRTRDYDWFHCDGNTNSIMDRNLAQGVALGADVQEDGVTTSLLPKVINQMDETLRLINPPKWPDEFPTINQQLAIKGEELFKVKNITIKGKKYSCYECHKDKKGTSFPNNMVNTNLARWNIFNLPSTNGPERLKALGAKVDEIKKATMAYQSISKETYTSWEMVPDPEWRLTIGYVAHNLDGIWASPPYLHNNSVRSLYQLLLPEGERDKSFFVGSREFDPKEVGYANVPGSTNFKYDTSEAANTNTGHNFGTHLSEEERWSIVEYLKSL